MPSVTKLTVPLALAGTLLVSVAGAGAVYGATTSELQARAHETATLTRKVEALEAEAAAQREWRARIETRMEYLVESSKRLEQRFGTNR